MTLVLPLPAPARISTGPSIVSTDSRCCGFNWSRKDNAETAPRAILQFFRGMWPKGFIRNIARKPCRPHRSFPGVETGDATLPMRGRTGPNRRNVYAFKSQSEDFLDVSSARNRERVRASGSTQSAGRRSHLVSRLQSAGAHPARQSNSVSRGRGEELSNG